MKLSNLAGKLRKHGLTVVETPGWAHRGFMGRDLLEVRGVLWHHTATNRVRFLGLNAPTLQMCIEGRPDVAGPLCQIVFGRDGTVYLTAAGLANHAGAGSAPGIPRDMGNHYLVGIEMESSGVAPWDWTEDQLRVAPHLGAALELELLQHLPAEQRLQIGHLEYSSQGKIDPAGWPGGMDGLRSSINKVLAAGSGGGTINVASSGGSESAPAPAPKPTKKGEEVPKHTIVASDHKPHRLPKSVDGSKVYRLSGKDDGTNQNFAVNGPGHYRVVTFLRGSGLPAGEKLTVTFELVKDGRISAYDKQDVLGSADGTFNHPVVLEYPIAGQLLNIAVESSVESAYVAGFRAHVVTWKEG
ncbi:endolysin [Arthrobacter phage Polka]|uniref:Endolysin n=1 Tax=Arthrobacter phage Polka TaxID=2419966 RepID=A0A3G2KIR8_9CAUD|nr:endolysin [Arthrobacter phage Polka]